MSHYDVLGVGKEASQDEIKAAYRKLAKQHHPDKGGNHEEFVRVQLAYDVLSDPEKRAHYDQHGDNQSPDQQANDIIVTVFNRIIQGQDDVVYKDPIRELKKYFRDRKGPLRGQRHQLLLELRKWRKVSKRLRVEPGNPLLHAVRIQRLQLIQRFKQTRSDLRMLERILEITKDYGYHTDKRPKQQVQGNPYQHGMSEAEAQQFFRKYFRG